MGGTYSIHAGFLDIGDHKSYVGIKLTDFTNLANNGLVYIIIFGVIKKDQLLSYIHSHIRTCMYTYVHTIIICIYKYIRTKHVCIRTYIDYYTHMHITL